MFHYQREYDNPKLLEFLGTSHAEAEAATDWIKRIHAALGRAIEEAAQDLLDRRGRGDVLATLTLRDQQSLG
jgi:truncated hemoglobin YjbI